MKKEMMPGNDSGWENIVTESIQNGKVGVNLVSDYNKHFTDSGLF